jgi:DHA2 family multidrug resistance protein
MSNSSITQSNSLIPRWLIIFTIMSVAILEILDSTIVNVALPHMMASLGANSEQITWVITSYVVAAGMMVPLTGLLSKRLGTKNLVIISITGFMCSSMLCGMSQSLSMIVLFRFAQGAFGASLIPLSQTILRQSFAPEEQGKAMAIWGIGMMTAPVLGPTLGGYITEHTNWRWIFYINLPLCLIGIALCLKVIYDDGARIKQTINLTDLLLMFTGIGSLQLFLDQGNTKDWFHSTLIVILAIIAPAAITSFIVRTRRASNPLLDLSIYRNRTFTLCSILYGTYIGCLIGMMVALPVMLESQFHYTALITGETMAIAGAASALAMFATRFLMARISAKYLLVMGLCLTSLSAWWMSGIDLGASQQFIEWSGFIQGLGMGVFMVPVSALSLSRLAQHKIAEGAALYNYGRMLGQAVGVSIISTLITRLTQINWHSIAGHITAFSPNTQHWANAQQLSLNDPTTISSLQAIVSQQANMQAYIDVYALVAMVFLALIPVALLLPNNKQNQ